MKNLDQTTTNLKNIGLKTTPARRAILSIFEENHSPFSAEDVWIKIKEKKVNLATVYRNIISLETAGILKRVDLRKPSVYYELKSLTHHHHISCSSCGIFEDISFCEEKDFVKNVLKQSEKFLEISDHSFEFFGTCKKCKK